MRIVKNNILYESFFDDVDSESIEAEDNSLLTYIDEDNNEIVDTRQLGNCFVFYYFVNNTDDLNKLSDSGGFLEVINNFNKIIELYDVLDNYALTFAYNTYTVSRQLEPYKDDVFNNANVVYKNTKSSKLADDFKSYVSEVSTHRYDEFCINLILTFKCLSEPIDEKTYKRVLTMSEKILRTTSMTFNKHTTKTVRCGMYDFKTYAYININQYNNKFIESQFISFIKKANEKYGFNITLDNRKNPSVIPDGFFDSLDESLRERYEVAIKRTGVRIEEKDNKVNITFPSDVSQYKLIWTLECALEFFEIDDPDSFNVTISGTLKMSLDILDYDWVPFVKHIHKIETDRVIVSDIESTLFREIFIDELECNNPVAANYKGPRTYNYKGYNAKIYIHDFWKNPDIKITSKTHLVEKVSNKYIEFVPKEFEQKK